MINSYVDFINEQIFFDRILEDLAYSDRFLDRLKRIKSGSIVARTLIDIWSGYIDKELQYNWVDLTDKPDYISFLSDQKFKQYLNQGLDMENSTYAARGRPEMSVGRFATRLLADEIIRTKFKIPEISQKDIEEFVNLFKSQFIETKNKFLLVKGDDIKKYYLEDNYASDAGQLGQSCMRYKEYQKYLKIYSENPKQVQLLVYLNEKNELLGRALVWKLASSPCSAKFFMDRVYTNYDSDIPKFYDYADKEGWLRKYRNGWEYLFLYKNQPIIGKITVQLGDVKFKNYPYMDTLYVLSEKDKTISNVHERKNLIVCRDTGGDTDKCDVCSGDGVHDITCQNCNGYGEIACPNCKSESPDGVYVPAFGCKNCKGKGLVRCDKCDGDGCYKGTCEYCLGAYERALMAILRESRFSLFHDAARKELEKLSS